MFNDFSYVRGWTKKITERIEDFPYMFVSPNMYNLFSYRLYHPDDKDNEEEYLNNETIKWINENLDDDVIKVGSILFFKSEIDYFKFKLFFG